MFLDSHSLRNGFKVFGVKGGPTTIVMNVNKLLIIMHLTSVNSMFEMVLILIIIRKNNIMSGANVRDNKS